MFGAVDKRKSNDPLAASLLCPIRSFLPRCNRVTLWYILYHKVTHSRKDKKKQRVLHTRVSEELDEELREKAAGLGVSVSNLVRNILLNTVEMVEDLVADSSSIARAASKDKPPAAPKVPDTKLQLLGWQELQLHLNALCEVCNAVLAKGSTAKVAVFSAPTAPVFRCASCIDADLITNEKSS